MILNVRVNVKMGIKNVQVKVSVFQNRVVAPVMNIRVILVDGAQIVAISVQHMKILIGGIGKILMKMKNVVSQKGKNFVVLRKVILRQNV